MMEYRLGRTDLCVSVLGFGTAPLGDVYGPTQPCGIQMAGKPWVTRYQ
jgi:aryl-alcohol dehydrogenase-like predicted oxidoreductase